MSSAPNYFLMLDRAEQRRTIERLSSSGLGENSIRNLTGVCLAEIRKILGEPKTVELKRASG